MKIEMISGGENEPPMGRNTTIKINGEKQDLITSFDFSVKIDEVADWNLGYKKTKKCYKCKQVDEGQTGEYPCSECGLPTMHDAEPLDADDITLDNWEGIVKCRKKPIIVHAVQLNFSEGFTVTTPEGPTTGKPGDYLMFGIDGEKYPCAKSIFERTYDIVK